MSIIVHPLVWINSQQHFQWLIFDRSLLHTVIAVILKVPDPDPKLCNSLLCSLQSACQPQASHFPVALRTFTVTSQLRRPDAGLLEVQRDLCSYGLGLAEATSEVEDRLLARAFPAQRWTRAESEHCGNLQVEKLLEASRLHHFVQKICAHFYFFGHVGCSGSPVMPGVQTFFVQAYRQLMHSISFTPPQ